MLSSYGGGVESVSFVSHQSTRIDLSKSFTNADGINLSSCLERAVSRDELTRVELANVSRHTVLIFEK